MKQTYYQSRTIMSDILWISAIALISSISISLFTTATADALIHQDYEYERHTDGGLSITDYIGASQTPTVPATIQGVAVTHIGASAFANKNLTSISLPNSIRNIGQNAFRSNSLTSINLGNSAGSRPVDTHGSLKTSGNKIVDKDGTPVQLRGVSTFHSNWGQKYFTKGTVDWLAKDFQASVIRVAVNVEGDGGYLEDPEANYQRMKRVVDAAIDNGMYAIIDWHDHNAHDHVTEAKAFFQKASSEYKNVPNVLYEVYNEPLPATSWSTIRSYANEVLTSIRSNSPNALVIVGTPNYSMRVDQAAQNPLTASNIAYTLHFYADGANQNYVRSLAQTAYDADVALFATEWGVGDYSGGGTFNQAETDTWMTFLQERNISSAMWSVGDKNEITAMLQGTASGSGNWSASNLRPAGQFIRAFLRETNGLTVGVGAFYDNQLETISVRGDVRNLSAALRADSYSTTKYARLFTAPSSNPYSLTDIPGQLIVNPASVTVSNVDGSGNPISSGYTRTGNTLSDYSRSSNETADFSRYYRVGESIQLEPVAIQAYTTPNTVTLTLAASTNEHTFVYARSVEITGAPNTGILQLASQHKVILSFIAIAVLSFVVVRKKVLTSRR